MKLKRNHIIRLGIPVLILVFLLCGCGPNTAKGTEDPMDSNYENQQGQLPAIPEKLKRNEQGIPVLQVYVTDEEMTREMDMETYLLGVLAGEMKNDWPMEALKAQAILARTFVLKFCTEKESQYENADISTDIEEAQAYDATGVNERIEKAVNETRGKVLSYQGELPYAWFHAHSGGKTARAKEGLAYEKEEPGYTRITEGNESPEAPENAKVWEAVFSGEEIMDAAEKAGYQGSETLRSIEIGKQGESGRALTISVNGRDVSAPEFRIALGSTKMRSTLLDSAALKDGKVTFSGKGYGHGVGMPQWGAYGMAQEGRSAEEIVQYYFQDVTVEKVW